MASPHIRGRQRVNQRRVKASLSRQGKRHAPIWEEILRNGRDVPEADLHKLPTDLALHHDRYLYGSRLS